MQWVDPLDAAMLTADVISNPLNIGAVLLLRPPRDAGPGYVDDLHDQTVAGEMPLDPRLRRYPHRGVDTGGIWIWRDAEHIDLSRHCLRYTLKPPGDRSSVWQLISRWHAEPLDRSRPMWMSYLVDGLEDGYFAIYLKVHHTVVDGVAGLQMITDALSADPKHRSMSGFFARQPAGAPPPAHEGTRIPNPLPLMRSLMRTATSSIGLAEQIAIGGASDLIADLSRDTRVPPLGAPFTLLNGRLGHDRAVAAGTWAKERIRSVQRAAGVTSNDVVTATVAGVLRRWFDTRDDLPRRSLVAFCPITVRGREHVTDRHGNKFGGWLCPLGTNLDDPVARLDLIHRSLSEGKQQVAQRGSGVSMLLLGTSIASTVLLPLLPLAPKARGYNLPISSVPGPPSEMYWDGAHVEEIYPVSAVYDGQGLNVTTCSYADRIGIGYVADRDMMPDIETLIPLTEDALAELEEAVG